ncbi:MAG: DUF4186 domain-containing protein [Ruminococcus sp.]|nr:DUF4186 domain-containing protein [Ruminococcus sp.]
MAENIKYELPDRSVLFQRLSRSKFRSRFHLSDKDMTYIREKGMSVIAAHAREFIITRLGEENPENDGKQTPMKGHPVFIAQHATACCCRGCLEKWHNIPTGKALNEREIEYMTNVLMDWIVSQLGPPDGQMTMI